MSSRSIDILGISQPIVDIIHKTTEVFLQENQLPKGKTIHIAQEKLSQFKREIVPHLKSSGGAVGNTLAIYVSLGGYAGMIGKIQNDEDGQFYAHEIQSSGVHYDPIYSSSNKATSVCISNITPDAQRSMCTYLGASEELGPGDINWSLVDQAKILYLEGFMWYKPHLADLCTQVSQKIKLNKGKVAFSLSDPLLVHAKRPEVLAFIKQYVDILFCNEHEAVELVNMPDQPEILNDLPHYLSDICPLLILTRSEKGSIIITKEKNYVIEAQKINQILDSTGAGDAYAGGFLYGYIHFQDIAKAGHLATCAAAHILQQYGARPTKSLKDLLLECA